MLRACHPSSKEDSVMRINRYFALLLATSLSGCGSNPPAAPPKGSDSPPAPNNTGAKPSDTANRITITTGIPAKTIAEYTDAIQKNPYEVNSRGESAFQLRGAALAKQGDHDNAIADYTEAIRLYRERKTRYYQIRLLEVFDARRSRTGGKAKPPRPPLTTARSSTSARTSPRAMRWKSSASAALPARPT